MMPRYAIARQATTSAIRRSCSIEARKMRAYPELSEAVGESAMAVDGKAIYF